ncbi:unnamed protein product [Allacma fusca]|uniref:Sodium-dependent glucose transporter 1 n=1 Tax=Allacma fusca TaxID=39272 RepID=A0A8J2KRL0_9HEXA|nr:unnamed protein product [Allacma fusca]
MDNGPKSIFSQASRTKKYVASLGVFYCAFCLGISMSFLNPTMLDFSSKLQEDVDTVSIAFTVLTAAYLFGALFSGIALNYIPRQLCVMMLLTFMAVPLFIFPYVESVMMLYVLTFIMGFGGGGFDTAQVAWIIDIWRHEAGPFILTQHFSYSVGTLIPPLIQGPYLTEEVKEYNCTTRSVISQEVSSTELPPYESQLQTPFTIGGSIVLISIIIQTCLYFFVFRQKKAPEDSVNKQNEIELEDKSKEVEPEASPTGKSDLRRKLKLIGLCCCVIGFYQGLELCTSQFIPTFSHFSDVCLSEKEGAQIAFGLQMGFASGRLCGILLVLKVAPHFILAGNFLLLLVCNIILLVWAGSNVTWLWIGSVGIGLGMSTVYPALYAYIEKYLFVTDSIAATVAVCGGLVSAIYPIVVGKSVEHNPEVMTYVNFLSIFVCVVAFSILFFITHVRAARSRKAVD